MSCYFFLVLMLGNCERTSEVTYYVSLYLFVFYILKVKIHTYECNF